MIFLLTLEVNVGSALLTFSGVYAQGIWHASDQSLRILGDYCEKMPIFLQPSKHLG